MSVTLDGYALFDEQGMQIGVSSHKRAQIERAVCGLDGVLSIDLGARTRVIRQTGMLHAPSRAAMCARVASISALIDGGAHTLMTAGGQEYRNVRMDSFKLVDEQTGGPGIVVEYEILYTQLGA
jgi:hypothetical protein